MGEYVIRISSLNTWSKCEGQAMANLDEDLIEDEAGPAAQTGTAVGRAIELFHKAILEKRHPDFDAILKQTREDSKDRERPFEGARWREVENMFHEYYHDPRNVDVVVLPEVQLQTEFVLGKDRITLIGTVDQIRLVDDHLEIWDLKAGQRDGYQMLFDYMPQLFGYTVALHKGGLPRNLTYPKTAYIMEARLGGVIRLQDYIKPLPRAGQKVFYPLHHSMRSIEKATERLLLRVLELRGGAVPNLRPGHHCSWCKLKSYEACVLLV